MSEPRADPPEGAPVEDLKDLYENAPCGYLSVRPDGRIFKANATFAHWMGFAVDELVGKKLHECLNIAGRIYYETHFAPLLRMQGFFHEVALDFVMRDGQRLPVLANAAERRDENGRHLFTRLTVFKAIDRRRYERELLEARAEARASQCELQVLNATLQTRIEEAVEERLRAEQGLADERQTAELREQFIAVLGHDLRNPIAAIGSGARMLVQEPISPRGHRILEMMQGSVLRMMGLIDNLLDFARGRLGGGLTLHRDADAPLTPVIEQVVAELQATISQRRIETRLQIVEPIDCDRDRIGQLVSNLLGNAVTHGAPDQLIMLEASTDQGLLAISIANRGKPIPAAAMDRLFQPFFRGEVQASRQGLGLGLFIASEIARAHGGTLEVQSTEEETRFTFVMPLAVPAPISERTTL